MSKDTLTVTDNRTGRSGESPIEMVQDEEQQFPRPRREGSPC